LPVSRTSVMKVEDAHDYLVEAMSVSNLESFMVFGGEPMLYPDRVIAILEKAHQLQVPRIDMITNGTWGKDEKQAEKLATRLKSAGLTNLDISVDAFHQQYIPIEYPRNAGLASSKAGIERVIWNATVVESIDAKNEYDEKTRQILKALEPTGIEPYIHKVLPTGRALKNLRQYFKKESLQGPCEGDPILENPLTDPKSICIDPSGSVEICWFLSIGNAKQVPLDRLISNYDCQKDAITRTLVEEGPTGLLKLPEVQDFSFEENEYIGKCHLCMEVRRALNA
jgi:MoaA/NifB/PqqE/SkfB family radical SAM enzyme